MTVDRDAMRVQRDAAEQVLCPQLFALQLVEVPMYIAKHFHTALLKCSFGVCLYVPMWHTTERYRASVCSSTQFSHSCSHRAAVCCPPMSVNVRATL
jgi:hypothetical protein